MNVSIALRRLHLGLPLLQTELELEVWKRDVLRPTYLAWQRAVHPDTNAHESATEQSQQVSEAYTWLSKATLDEMGVREGCRRVRRTVRVKEGSKTTIVIRIPYKGVADIRWG